MPAPTDWLGIAIAISQTGMAAAAFKLAMKHDKKIDGIEKRQEEHEKDDKRHVQAPAATVQ